MGNGSWPSDAFLFSHSKVDDDFGETPFPRKEGKKESRTLDQKTFFLLVTGRTLEFSRSMRGTGKVSIVREELVHGGALAALVATLVPESEVGC